MTKSNNFFLVVTRAEHFQQTLLFVGLVYLGVGAFWVDFILETALSEIWDSNGEPTSLSPILFKMISPVKENQTVKKTQESARTLQPRKNLVNS